MLIEELLAWYWKIIHAAAVGQIIFVLLWLTLPWWRTWVGRALMLKSFGFAVVLVVQLYFYHMPPNDRLTTIKIALFVMAFITVGIWGQVCAISYEMWDGRKRRKQKRRKLLDDSVVREL